MLFHFLSYSPPSLPPLPPLTTFFTLPSSPPLHFSPSWSGYPRVERGLPGRGASPPHLHSHPPSDPLGTALAPPPGPQCCTPSFQSCVGQLGWIVQGAGYTSPQGSKPRKHQWAPVLPESVTQRGRGSPLPKAWEPRVTESPRTMHMPSRMNEYCSILSFLIIGPLCPSSGLLKL